MKSFKQFLGESDFADLRPQTGQWVAIPTSVLKKAQHEPPINIDTELFGLLDKSYAYVGGHVDFQRPSDLPANHTLWYGIDVDGDKEPEAVIFGKESPYGKKWTGGASDGSPAGKNASVQKFVSLLRTPGNFCEMSDAIMHIMITRYQVPCIDSKEKVEKILGKPVRWVGVYPEGKYSGYAGFYVRSLGGSDHMKILLGLPK